MSSPATGPLIPQAFWFRMAAPCRRLEEIPRAPGKGRLLELPESCTLPTLVPLDGREPWAEVRAAWNPSGLGVSVALSGKPGPLVHDPNQPDRSDGVQIWIDTRDTRDVHRASRFCHRFAATLHPGRGDGIRVDVLQRNIARALGEPPRARLDAVMTRGEARSRPRGWLVELFFKAEALHGFDPETNRRLGFLVQVTDPDRGDQFTGGLGREFPVGEDPSLWSTLELLDTPA